MPLPTIPQQFHAWGRARPEAPAYGVWQEEAWQLTNWRTYTEQVWQAAKALLALGLAPEEATTILGPNRPEWTIFDLATMTAGGVPVGIYVSCAPPQIQYITHHAEARVLLVESWADWEKVAPFQADLPHLQHVVLMDGSPPTADPMVYTWADFLALGDALDDATLEARLAAIRPEQRALLIYTSGTTGPPKGVSLSHLTLVAGAEIGNQLLPGEASRYRLLSYLPLAHAAEHGLSVLGAATRGYCVYFVTQIEQLPQAMQAVRPDAFLGVPRVWEKIHAGMTAKLSHASGTKQRLFTWATGIGRKVTAHRALGETPTGWLALQYRLAHTLIFSKVQAALGLDRATLFLSGAAPLSQEVLGFFAGLDILIQEVYGQTEDCGPTTFNRPGQIRFGSVGQPFDRVEVRLAEDGELLVRGPHVFEGYYKDPDATAHALREGWLHSGDLARQDADGFFYITGRKKEILITAGGKNIAPRNLEDALKEHPLVGEAVLVGDRRRYLTALLTLDPEAAAAFAQQQNLPEAEVSQAPALLAALQTHLDAVNAGVSRVEAVKKFAVLPEPFSVAAGELTPTLKLKRSAIHVRHAETIEALYAD